MFSLTTDVTEVPVSENIFSLLYNSILHSSTVLFFILYLILYKIKKRGSDRAAYYGVASASRLLKIIGFFCKRAL